MDGSKTSPTHTLTHYHEDNSKLPFTSSYLGSITGTATGTRTRTHWNILLDLLLWDLLVDN